MTDNVSLHWPCRVTREPDGRYCVTPYSAMQCARDGSTLYAASLSAGEALHRYICQAVQQGQYPEPPPIDVRPEELRAGRVIKLVVHA